MNNFEMPRETLVSDEAVKEEVAELMKELRVLERAEPDTDREIVVKDNLRKEELRKEIERYRKTHSAAVSQAERESGE